MSKKTSSPKNIETKSVVDPATVLEAAKATPRVFSVGAYFAALYTMRAKGYSWRYLADWLRRFNIEISHVHLHRLYVAEDIRRSKLTTQELETLGMPPGMIEDFLDEDDPAKSLAAGDPEDVIDDKNGGRDEWLRKQDS